MAIAEALCVERGQRLTPIRRKVLDVLLGSHKPLGAYEIIDRLAPKGPRPAPITAYRALDFLRENGLVHRIESRNAFIACVHNHAAGDLVVFLICERCGAVGEASSPTSPRRSPRRRAPPASRPSRRCSRSAASAPTAARERRIASSE